MKNVFNPKEYRDFLCYVIVSLFLTNLFIFVYKILLRLLNSLFPPAINPDLFSKAGLSPEPFEIPLYLILSILWVLIIIIFPRFLNKLRFLGWPIFLFLVILFYINIGNYPLKDDLQFIQPAVDQTKSIFILAGYLLTITIITIIAYYLRRWRLFLFFFILGVVALFTFEPGFPSSAHDTSYFLGPIYEITHAKTIFTTTSSQYGFLSILVLSILTKLHLFNPFYLPLLTWLLYVLQYFLCFYIVYKSSKSVVLAFLGLFSILTINYFSLYHLPNTYPQIGPLRWLSLLASLFIVQRYKTITDPKLIFLLSLLSLWNVEAGIALFLSYAFTLFILIIVGSSGKKKLISSLLLFTCSIVAIFIILNITHVILGKQTIDYILMFSKLRTFAITGIFMIPVPWRTHFWFVILIYFVTIIYFFRQKEFELGGEKGRVPESAQRFFQPVAGREHLREGISRQNLTQLLLFSANLSLFASVYYVGRSHPHNLFHISIFPILNAFLLFGLLFKRIQNSIFYLLASIFLFLFFIVYPGYNRKQALASMIQTKFDRLKNRQIFRPELEDKIKRYYFSESNLIKKNFPKEEMLILSTDDTYLFYLVDKKNLLLDNPQSSLSYVPKTDLNLALIKASKNCPEKIIANCTLFKLCPKYQTFNHETINIPKILLESLEKSCKVKYRPIKCTNKLCAASY